MTIGFFTVFRIDPQHYLHAAALVAECCTVLPSVPVVHLTDDKTPAVPGVRAVHRCPFGPMLERRLESYAATAGDWLLVDTDVSVRQDVRDVFDDPWFDVAVTDRNWPHLPQPADVLQTMPFNTGVMFSRSGAFWQEVLAVWRAYPEGDRDWMSEQRAVAEVVKTGRFRVKVLPGMVYNYPPGAADAQADAAIWHYKGPHRKAWLSARAYSVLGHPVAVPV
jgi:hypothetical protein